MKSHKARVNWHAVLAWGALLIGWALYFVFALAWPLRAQTQLRADQVLGGIPAAAESEWCPGPVFQLENDRTLLIGANWTPERPCFAHFNLGHAPGVDPILISAFTAPARVRLRPGTVLGDNPHIYFAGEIAEGGAVTRAQSIIVGAAEPQQIESCENCVVERAEAGARVLPARSLIGGFAYVANGRFSPALDCIVCHKQVSIDVSMGISLRRDPAGVWIGLVGGQGGLAPAALPPIGTSGSAEALSRAEDLRSRVQQIQDGIDEARAETAAPGTVCGGPPRLGTFQARLYACTEGRWRRVRVEE